MTNKKNKTGKCDKCLEYLSQIKQLKSENEIMRLFIDGWKDLYLDLLASFRKAWEAKNG